jgi:hypothetical protein
MLSLCDQEKIFFSQKVKIKKVYSNIELKYFQYFHRKTNIIPEHVIVINRSKSFSETVEKTRKFVFFFVKSEDYFKALFYKRSIRREIGNKVQILRVENVLVNLLFAFFPDPYIHDVKFSKKKNFIFLTIYFLSFEERGIAIGRSGDYIKAVNEIFEKFVILQENHNINSLKIKCELIEL